MFPVAETAFDDGALGERDGLAGSDIIKMPKYKNIGIPDITLTTSLRLSYFAAEEEIIGEASLTTEPPSRCLFVVLLESRGKSSFPA